MTSVWTEADRHAREAIEAELRRRGTYDADRFREALRQCGQRVSVRALELLGRGAGVPALSDYVRDALPA